MGTVRNCYDKAVQNIREVGSGKLMSGQALEPSTGAFYAHCWVDRNGSIERRKVEQ